MPSPETAMDMVSFHHLESSNYNCISFSEIQHWPGKCYRLNDKLVDEDVCMRYKVSDYTTIGRYLGLPGTLILMIYTTKHVE